MLALRLTLLAPLLSASPSSGVVYEVREAPRAGTVLLDTPATSRLQCGLRCLLEGRCTHWTFDVPTSRCRLYPPLSSDSAPRVAETIYVGKNIPDGYRRYKGTSKAFRRLPKPLITGTEILEQCRLEGPRVSPAVPESEEEFQILRGLIPTANTPANIAWLGVHVTETEGVYGDMFGRVLDLNQSWLYGTNTFSSSLPCVRMFNVGLDLNWCYPEHSYICQYETY